MVGMCPPAHPFVRPFPLLEQSDDFRKNLSEQHSITGDTQAVHWLSNISSTNMHQELSCESRATFLVPTVLSWNVV